jgi:hypothetical protein
LSSAGFAPHNVFSRGERVEPARVYGRRALR